MLWFRLGVALEAHCCFKRAAACQQQQPEGWLQHAPAALSVPTDRRQAWEPQGLRPSLRTKAAASNDRRAVPAGLVP